MGGQTQTRNEQRDPYAPAVPYINDVMSQAQNLYRSGAGSGTWNGPTLSNMDPNTIASMRMMQNQALNTDTSQPFQFNNQMMQNGGMSQGMMPALRSMGQVANGQNGITTGGMFGNMYGRAQNINSGANGILGDIAGSNPITTAGQYGDVAGRAQNTNSDLYGTLGGISGGGQGIGTNGFQDLYNSSSGQNAGSVAALMNPGSISTGSQYASLAGQAGGPTAADQYLTDMAKGGQANPYLQSILDDNAARMANRANSAASGAGRYGSAGHSDSVVRSIAEANNPLLAQAYDSDQNRRLQATGLIDSSRQGANATRLAAIGGQTGVEGQNIANTMSGAMNAANIRQGDTQISSGLLGNIANIQNQNIGNQLSASGMLGNFRNANIQNELAALSGQTGAQGQNASLRMGAAGALADSNRADTASAMNALQGLTGVQGQNINNRMNASQGLLGAYGQGLDRASQNAAMAPQSYNFAGAGAQQLGQIGQYMQGRSQAELDAQRQAFDQQQQMPWQQLSRYSGALQGMSPLIGNAGSSTSTQTQASNPWQTAAGLGLAGAGMFMGNPMMGMQGLGMAGGAAQNPFGQSMMGGYMGGYTPVTNQYMGQYGYGPQQRY